MKADKTVSPPTERRKELDRAIRELAGELHNRISEAHAIMGVLAAVSALTELTAASLGRLRHIVIAGHQALGEAFDKSIDLGAALAAQK